MRSLIFLYNSQKYNKGYCYKGAEKTVPGIFAPVFHDFFHGGGVKVVEQIYIKNPDFQKYPC
jgi:hypothetical protein